MSLTIYTFVKVLSKFTTEKEYNGTNRIFYNLKLADVKTYDNQIVSCSQELFDSVDDGQLIGLSGTCGGLKDKFFSFKSVASQSDLEEFFDQYTLL